MDFSLLGQVQTEVVSILGTLASQTLNQLSGSLTNQLNTLLGSLSGLLAGKRSINLLQVQQQIQNTLPLLQNLFSSSSVSIQSIFDQFQSSVSGFLSNLSSPQARSTLLLASQQVKGDIADAFNSLLNEAMGHLTSIATSLANVGLASILGALSGKRGIWDDLTSALSGITSTLSGHVDNITSSLVSVGSSLLGSVTPHLQDLQDQLTNHALNAAQSLLGTLSGISGSLSG